MNIFKNMKMRFKLVTAFSVIILLTLISATVSIYNLNSLKLTDQDQYTDVVVPVVDISDIRSDYLLLRVFLCKGVAFAGETEELGIDLSQSEAEYLEMKESLLSKMETYKIYFDNNIEEEDRRMQVARLQELIVDEYMPMADKIVAAVSSGNENLANRYLQEGGAIAEELTGIFESEFDQSVIILETSTESKNKLLNNITILTIIFALFVFISSITISLVVGNLISKKIITIAKAMKEVSVGNFDTNFISNDADEIGDLSRNLGTVIETIHDIVTDIEILGEKQKEGSLSYKIDEEKYLGLYSTMIKTINESFSTLVYDVNEILVTMDEFANGNFEAEMTQFKGEKEQFNIAIEGFRNNLKGINEGIGKIVENATQGDLQTKVDSDRYKGDWKDLVDSLNELMDVINEPIIESIEVLQSLANGDLDSKMVGNYNGEFELIKTTINTTIASLAGYIVEISSTLGSLAKNNFDTKIEKEFVGDFDEMKQSINQIIEKLNEVFKEFLVGADEVSQGAQQISQSSIYLAEGATKQVSSLEELNAAVEIVNDKTITNANAAKEANQIASLASENAALGDEKMKSMLVSMDEISASSSQIGQVIKVIDDIAFQTNLLALNAAVEAARAGAHGKGFAVVAEEVRSLAVRSQEAAKETTELIDTSINKVVIGSTLAKDTAKALDEIVKNVSDVSELIAGISEASQSQSISMGEISKGLTEVESVIQNNSAAAEEGVSTAEELSSQSVVLRSLIGSYKLME